MLALVLRGFMQRKLRVLLTAIAIALGVALMAGTYILTDTINHSFANIFSTAYKGHDVVVSPAEKLGRETRSQISPITERTLAQVRAVPGVAQASGGIFSNVTILSTHGKRLSSGGAPSFLSAVVPGRFESYAPVRGRFPENAGEVDIDQGTAARKGLGLGQQIVVAGSAPAKRYTIVGIAKFAGSQSFGGSSSAILTLPEAQRVVDSVGQYDEIDIAAAAGVSADQLRARVRAALPSSVSVRTGAAEAAKQTSDLESNLGFLRTFLLIFAYVALVVGAFIIFNTFSITVAQRTRELGLLRTLGASRRQVMGAVIYEGLMLGVVGAVIGLFLGLALAPALNQLFIAFGAELPTHGTVLEARTVIVSLLVGVVVTVLAGLFPALRATRVPPLAAMREGVEIPPRPLPTRRALIVRFVLGLVLSVVVGVVLGRGLGLVLLVIFVIRGVRLRLRLRRGGERPPRRYRVVPALGGALGLLVSWRGITGRLARENSIRQPGRTLVTALALTVGLALVAFISVLADGTKATINQAVTRSFAGDLIVENSQAGGEQGIPPGIAQAVKRVPGVASATPISFTLGRVRDLSQRSAPQIADTSSITAIEPASFDRVYRIEWERGSNATLLELGNAGTVLNKSFASAHHLHVGDRLAVLTPSNHSVTLKVVGIAKDNARLLANLTIDRALAQTSFGQREDGVDFISYAKGADGRQVQSSVNRLLASQFPQARSRTAAQFKKDQEGQINQLLLLIYVLLALSVVVSLFGIVNTLILSVYERTRELGMMRAIGTSRRQIRQMIRYESVITGLIGGVFGLVIGTVGAVLVSTLALSGSGFVLAIPVGTLILLLVISALAGLIASQLPARRAARLDVLQALAGD
jgi:putative ABC transport system permease protein